MKIMCGQCGVECKPYLHYKTIGECPSCKDLLTVADGGDVDVVEMKIPAR